MSDQTMIQESLIDVEKSENSMQLYRIRKTYSNLKAAHRQWRHKGHCAGLHGENWTFTIGFVADRLGEDGFVIDFGSMAFIRSSLEDLFDHTVLIDSDDPEKCFFEQMASQGLAKVRFVPSASAEGLAELVYDIGSKFCADLSATEGRTVSVETVTCFEDEKNSAIFCPPIKVMAWSIKQMGK